MAEQECAHPDCECMIEDNRGVTQDGEIYCSTYCAKSGLESQSEECQCGHAECV